MPTPTVPRSPSTPAPDAVPVPRLPTARAGLGSDGDASGAQLIRQSWRRCRDEFALRPDLRREPSIRSVDELRRRRRALGSVFEIGIVELGALQRQLGLSAGLTLTDTDGVILHYLGTPAFTREAQRAGMREGAVWSEAELGTNGIGTCLVAHRPLLVRNDDHFLHQNAGLVCCAAPIRNGQGEVVAVLNLSCLDGESGVAMLALVTQAARSIETHALLHEAGDRYVLRLHVHPALVASDAGALLLVDRDGTVTGCNQTVRDWLGAGAAALLGRPLAASLGLSIDELGDRARSAPWQPQRLDDPGLFVLVQPPASAESPGADALDRAERRALLEVVEASGWNVTLAARRLGVDRKTLHRKLQRHGLARPAAR